MIPYPDINPIAFQIGPLKVHWYGLMYLLAFYGCWWMGTIRAKKPHVNWPKQRVGDLLFYAVLGVILGGRIGYVLFYAYTPDGQWLEWLHPMMIFQVWDGGMSFHGGLIGVLIAMGVFARRVGLSFWEVADFAAVLTPFGLFTGRIGNFINGELWGKVTDLPWGMVFPRAHADDMAYVSAHPALLGMFQQFGGLPRQPTELYEAVLEGLCLLAFLWWFSSKPRPRMAISGLFLLGYGAVRFAVEFIRLPDPQFGYLLWGWVTMGQLLCVPMLVGGAIIFYLAHHKRGAAA